MYKHIIYTAKGQIQSLLQGQQHFAPESHSLAQPIRGCRHRKKRKRDEMRGRQKGSQAHKWWLT